MLSSISLGTTLIPRKNWKQWLCKILGGKCILVYVKMVNLKQIWCSSCRDHFKIYKNLGNDIHYSDCVHKVPIEFSTR